MSDSPSLVLNNREEWRSWLEDNHSTKKEAWMVIQKGNILPF
ncbi:MAG: hypothetical protein NWE89_00740 [Candidatus Bathyarchaeota archaeon]|nr:hypothetical protein [Candidatus Bathyarchaeota archaeon]